MHVLVKIALVVRNRREYSRRCKRVRLTGTSGYLRQEFGSAYPSSYMVRFTMEESSREIRDEENARICVVF